MRVGYRKIPMWDIVLRVVRENLGGVQEMYPDEKIEARRVSSFWADISPMGLGDGVVVEVLQSRFIFLGRSWGEKRVELIRLARPATIGPYVVSYTNDRLASVVQRITTQLQSQGLFPGAAIVTR